MATRKKTGKSRRVVQPRKENLLVRLNRVSGQVAGIRDMVAEDRYCVDILTQISAVKSALDSVAMALLEDHTRHCVHDAVKHGGGEQTIEELVQIVKKYAK